MPDDLRDHYLRALLLLRDIFDALALDHVEDAPATVPLRIPVDLLLAWRTRAAALPLEEAGQVWLSELSRASRPDAASPAEGEAAAEGIDPDALTATLRRLEAQLAYLVNAQAPKGGTGPLPPDTRRRRQQWDPGPRPPKYGDERSGATP